MKPKDIPNTISVLRILAVIPIVMLLIVGEYGWAMVLFAVAGASDALDGFLAKHYGWRSRLGGILDPAADKALLLSCFLVLGWQGLIPPWLVLAVLLRDLVIVSGALIYNFGIETVEASPILVSKLNTLVQILLVVMVIMNAGPISLPSGLIASMVWVCLLTVVVSGSEYVWIWGRKARVRGWRH
ncbi:MAG: CDP-alcohol phosphatidyltransferase family protein [Sphingobacteriia bacterium]|nr:CDP-alcohol phosphatidyltransferase family protein [Sphingobacteriia bacterium]NCC37959.1 CDP-alcohol phosphatidyltransferase family protein [Gammaproteobacteria bacterium]